MSAAGGRATDQQRRGDAAPIHLAGDVNHLVEARRNQSRQPDNVRANLERRVQNPLRTDHHAEIRDLVAVAAQHDADDVLADVMHVALDGRQQHAPRSRVVPDALVSLEIGGQVRHGFFHHPRRFDDLRQEHFARAEQIPDDVHAVHQRPFDHLERTLEESPCFLGVQLHKIRNALHERVLEALLDIQAAPLDSRLRGFLVCFELLRDLEQSLARVGSAVEDHVLDAHPQLGLDIFIDLEHPRVDDAHVQPRPNRVVQKNAVHRLADRVVAPETERDVADATRDERSGQIRFDPARRLDEVQRVTVVGLDARGNGQYIRVKDNVPRLPALRH